MSQSVRFRFNGNDRYLSADRTSKEDFCEINVTPIRRRSFISVIEGPLCDTRTSNDLLSLGAAQRLISTCVELRLGKKKKTNNGLMKITDITRSTESYYHVGKYLRRAIRDSSSFFTFPRFLLFLFSSPKIKGYEWWWLLSNYREKRQETMGVKEEEEEEEEKKKYWSIDDKASRCCYASTREDKCWKKEMTCFINSWTPTCPLATHLFVYPSDREL